MRGEMGSEVPEELEEGLSVEKQQEQQLMNKLASQGRLPARPASSFLQKKLQQRKFFDSGDYAMDQDRSKQVAPPVGRLPHPMAAPPILSAACPVPKSTSVATTEPTSPDGETNLQIPRPDTVPQRKASIINPSVHCKLSPMPHVQSGGGIITSISRYHIPDQCTIKPTESQVPPESHHDGQPAQLPSVE